MAKTIAKKTVKKAAPKKKATAPAKKKPALSLEELSEQILDKLKALDVDPQLQSDIGWCLGSYRHDQNPVGLYATTRKALAVFAEVKAKNSKSVTAKLMGDMEKMLATENK